MKKQGVIEAIEGPEAAASEAIKGYDPSEDPRLWRSMSEMWKQVAVDFADIASGYTTDCRAVEIAGRLRKELGDRIAQEAGCFAEFKEQFRRTASEWIARRRSDAVTASMNEQLQGLEIERQAAAERARAQDRAIREAKAAELERQAAVLREGPASRTTSYLAR